MSTYERGQCRVIPVSSLSRLERCGAIMIEAALPFVRLWRAEVLSGIRIPSHVSIATTNASATSMAIQPDRTCIGVTKLAGHHRGGLLKNCIAHHFMVVAPYHEP